MATELNISKQKLTVTKWEFAANGSKDYLQFYFSFDSTWNEYTKSVIFYSGTSPTIKARVLITNNRCTVPSHVLNGSYMCFSCIGETPTGKRITTNGIKKELAHSGYTEYIEDDEFFGLVAADGELSTTSENPVQNKIVTEEFNRLVAAINELATISGFCIEIPDLGGEYGGSNFYKIPPSYISNMPTDYCIYVFSYDEYDYITDGSSGIYLFTFDMKTGILYRAEQDSYLNIGLLNRSDWKAIDDGCGGTETEKQNIEVVYRNEPTTEPNTFYLIIDEDKPETINTVVYDNVAFSDNEPKTPAENWFQTESSSTDKTNIIMQNGKLTVLKEPEADTTFLSN